MRLVAAWRGAVATGDGVPAVALVPVMTTPRLHMINLSGVE